MQPKFSVFALVTEPVPNGQAELPGFSHAPQERTRKIEVSGRIAWALLKLIEAGEEGCTPIDSPGPRWSDYVFKLRKRYDVNIATVHEPHGGPFKGTHA